MNSSENEREQVDSVSDAAKLMRSNQLAWRWQRIGLIVGMTVAAILTTVLPELIAKKDPVKPVARIEVEKASATIATQLSRVKLTDALRRLRELDSKKSEMQQEVLRDFEQLETNQAGRRIASDESAMLRYRILGERLNKIVAQTNAVTRTEEITVLSLRNHSAHQFEVARQHVRDRHLSTIDEVRTYQAFLSVLTGLIEETQVSPMHALTLERAVDDYDRKKSQMLLAKIELTTGDEKQEAAEQLREIRKQIEAFRARTSKISMTDRNND